METGANVHSTNSSSHKTTFLVFLVMLLGASLAHGQSEPEDLNAMLKEEILSPDVA